MPRVTVAICTYRRPALLAKCLAALAQQTVPRQDFAVLVVDNYGDEETRTVASEHGAEYVYEPAAGLSHARNRAATETCTRWIFYLDDDAIPHPDMVAQFLKAILNPSVRIVGGRYDHYFATPPPRWVHHYYRTGVRASPAGGIVALKADQYLSGGIMAAETELVRRFPFRTDLGMRAMVPGYGEETEWQDRLRQAGETVWFCGAIAMDHLVAPRKYTIKSRVLAAAAHGRYAARTQVRGKERGAGWLAETLRIIVVTLPYDVARAVFKSGFYWQNGLVSTLTKLAFVWGKYGK